VRNERGARVARGSAIAVFATFTASLAHTVGGGTPPGLLAVALALAFSVPFAIATVGRRASVARAGVAALGAQLALHALYSLGTAGTAATALMDASGRTIPSHTHAHPSPLGLAASGEPAGVLAIPGAAVHGTHPGVWMSVTHVVAAALTIVFIAGADRVLAAVTASARGIRIALVLAHARLGAPGAPTRPTPLVARTIGSARDLHLLSTRRRGPPMAATAA
jgi:hypothetical protein